MQTIQNINYQLFSLINAPADLHGFSLTLAIIVAKYLVYLVPLWLILLWVFAAPNYRGTLLFAVMATIAALIVSYIVGVIWPQPRPFMIPLGHTYLAHAPDNSFPSHHVTFIWAVGLSLLLQPGLRFPGSVLLVLALAVGWARVFVGVHFPFDILGAIIIASVVVLILSPIKTSINRKLLPIVEGIYRKIFPGRPRQYRQVRR